MIVRIKKKCFKDIAIGRIFEACKANGYVMMVTADHGNAEKMMAPDGSKHTAHTCNRGRHFFDSVVPCGGTSFLTPSPLTEEIYLTMSFLLISLEFYIELHFFNCEQCSFTFIILHFYEKGMTF